jgi:Zn-finger nucleic acid-binding protein
MCPACKEPLVVFELDGVEIDRCLKCGGTWLDDGEIDPLARLAGGAPDPLQAAIAAAGDGKPGDRRCVRCATKMKLVTVQTVELDRCPRGHGLWFDRNEMETLIAASKEGGAAKFFSELHPTKSKKGE